MALKKQFQAQAAFSMASMTDIIFLLLIFFMVTSTFVFPTALEINLPQSSEQTAIKPTTQIFIDSLGTIYTSAADSQTPPEPLSLEQLTTRLQDLSLAPEGIHPDYIAVYADRQVTYGTLVQILDLGAKLHLKMVLATVPAPSSALPTTPEAASPQ